MGRQVALYFAWSRPEETAASLGILEDRFPALFELRRVQWPRLERLADPAAFDQGIDGFLDHVQLANFRRFAELVEAWSGKAVRQAERVTPMGTCALGATFLAGVDTLIVMSFDSTRTGQRADVAEIAAVRAFLDDPEHVVFVCPHHDIGNTDGLDAADRQARREAEFHHHGDPAIPARQGFGDFGQSLLAGLGLEVRNRFGLRPAHAEDGTPAPLLIDRDDGLLAGVTTFNLHPHLPHFDRIGDAVDKLDVLARQAIDSDAPPHPFTAGGRFAFDALLQSRPGVFAGRLLVCDTTLWSSTAGGLDSLERFWRNVVQDQNSEG